jgi:serine/threonine protein kinase
LDLFQGILSDGEEIAVKTLLGRTGDAVHQLQNEVQVLAEVQHKNLVRLLGICSHQNDTLLVYEYIKNGSLDSFLFGIFLFNHLFSYICRVTVNKIFQCSVSVAFHESQGHECC